MARGAVAAGWLVAACHAAPRVAPTPASDAECCCTYVAVYTIPGAAPDEPDRTEMPVVSERMAADQCLDEAHAGTCAPSIAEACRVR